MPQSAVTYTYSSFSQTWTVPPNTTSIDTMECWGGGGSGSPRNNNGSFPQYTGGGGGGAYSRIDNNLVEISFSIGDIYEIYVGNIAGNTYIQDTKSTNIVVAEGGFSGKLGYFNGMAGGNYANGVGDFKYSGGSGANANTTNACGGGGGGAAGNAANGGNGVDNVGGTGGNAGGGNGGNGGTNKAGNGLNGEFPGGGGGGTSSASNFTGVLPGNGSTGYVKITYTYSTSPSNLMMCEMEEFF